MEGVDNSYPEISFLIRRSFCGTAGCVRDVTLTSSDRSGSGPKADGCPYDESAEQLEELKPHFLAPRDAIAYIMYTFTVVRRKDEEAYGEYRAKRVILKIYDAM